MKPAHEGRLTRDDRWGAPHAYRMASHVRVAQPAVGSPDKPEASKLGVELDAARRVLGIHHLRGMKQFVFQDRCERLLQARSF